MIEKYEGLCENPGGDGGGSELSRLTLGKVKMAAEATAAVAHSFGSDYRGRQKAGLGGGIAGLGKSCFDEGAAEMVMVGATADDGGGEGDDSGDGDGECDGRRRQRNHITVSHNSIFTLTVSVALALLHHLFLSITWHYLSLFP